MAEIIENFDSILRDWAEYKVQNTLSRHWTGTRSRKKNEKAVFLSENDSEIILEQSSAAVERD